MDNKLDSNFLITIRKQLEQVLADLQAHSLFTRCKLLVIGCSTSEVVGKDIGTSGTTEVAMAIYNTIKEFGEKHQIAVAFQCCEHLNRALVIEEEVMKQYRFEEVSVVPIRSAGGALAECAYRNMSNAVMVEHIVADAGIDIGDTFIGMHLKHVAVPVRSQVKEIGKAHVTLALSRPKLIGGPRACYDQNN